MRQIRLYQDIKLVNNMNITLSEQASHHLVTVLRKQEGTAIILFNGQDIEAHAILTKAHRKHAEVVIHEIQTISRESSLKITLAQCIGKSDKMEQVIQKATELGVYCIYPLISQHMAYKIEKEKLTKKHAQWIEIAINAAEQCGRNRLPIIKPIMAIQQYIEEESANNKLILNPESTKNMKSLNIAKSVAILIGPEGGLYSEEINHATKHGFINIALGPRILRTETAALTAISLVQGLYGDLG